MIPKMVTSEVDAESENTSLERRMQCLRESRLQECAQLALAASVDYEPPLKPAVIERLSNTVDTILALSRVARSVFEASQVDKQPVASLSLDEEQLLALLSDNVARRAEDSSRPAPDETTAQIRDKDPIALTDKLDIDDDDDQAFDAAAQRLLGNLEGVEVGQFKRYTRYNLVIGLNHPRSDLLLAITRRNITPEEDNPIEEEYARHIDDPHGVHYSIVFEPVAKRN
jgi:hypothetical protein